MQLQNKDRPKPPRYARQAPEVIARECHGCCFDWDADKPSSERTAAELKQEKLCLQAKCSVPNSEGCKGNIWLKDTKAGRLHYITLKLENHHVN
jgi:hypothetical protein